MADAWLNLKRGPGDRINESVTNNTAVTFGALVYDDDAGEYLEVTALTKKPVGVLLESTTSGSTAKRAVDRFNGAKVYQGTLGHAATTSLAGHLVQCHTTSRLQINAGSIDLGRMCGVVTKTEAAAASTVDYVGVPAHHWSHFLRPVVLWPNSDTLSNFTFSVLKMDNAIDSSYSVLISQRAATTAVSAYVISCSTVHFTVAHEEGITGSIDALITSKPART